uniref:Uncharacterized protein n=1 Tax=Arundo donax TaxID=35708 RepID=A0A0A8YIV8_ARUDO
MFSIPKFVQNIVLCLTQSTLYTLGEQYSEYSSVSANRSELSFILP